MRKIDDLKWNGYKTCFVEYGYYIDRNDVTKKYSAFKLLLPDGECLSVATINIMAEGKFYPVDGQFFIKNYSEHIGLGKALVNAGVIMPVGRTIEFGPWDASADEYLFTARYQPFSVELEGPM